MAIHRRFGKTVLAVNELIDIALNCPLHNPRVAYIAPFYKQAKAVAWDYAKDYTAMIPSSKAYESELRIDIPKGEVNGKKSIARIMCFGADNPDALRGLYFDAVVFDEFGNQPISIWSEVVRPALADRKGRALFLGTPNGKNHFYEKYQEASRMMNEGHPEWYAATFRADETNVIDAEELESARQNMPESDYRQEFLCDWAAAIKGAFYAHDIGKARDQGRVMRIPYEKGLPVYAAFDLGIDDMTAVWFMQCFRSEIRLIHYQEWENTGLTDVLKDMMQMPYIYGELIMPWDVKVRELTSGKTRLEVIESLGFNVIVAPKISIEDGINAVRTILSQCYFDKVGCESGLDALENYRKRYDQRTGLYLKTPVHDEFSHGADAFRYLAVAYDPYMGEMLTNNSSTHRKRKPQVKRSC
ncbi:MAG: hypothetical protein HRU21_09770 [Pseudomonadales bacterium]|nr:hypothetical protein [Pseudomonadales bacterium]